MGTPPVVGHAIERDLALPGAGGGEVDGHEPGGAERLTRLHHEMRHPSLDRIDDHVGQLAERAVGAADGLSHFEAHGSRLPRGGRRRILPIWTNRSSDPRSRYLSVV